MTKRKKPLRYFFYNGDLCKKEQINRGSDVITAWNYRKKKLEAYIYSDVRKNGERAFSTKEVAEMLQRSVYSIKLSVREGLVPRPQITYTLDEKRNEYQFFWCESDIMGLHEYYKTVHYGRPRNDGRVTPKELPTASELRAMIRQGTVLYVKVGEEFVPTWRANSL